MLTRRSLLLTGAAAPFVAAAPFAARAQTWPSGTLRLVVPYPPAGSTDAMMRLVQPTLQQRLGATIIIHNRAGASGSVAPPRWPSRRLTAARLVVSTTTPPIRSLPNLPYDTEKDPIRSC